jgi:hypothetical protein
LIFNDGKKNIHFSYVTIQLFFGNPDNFLLLCTLILTIKRYEQKIDLDTRNCDDRHDSMDDFHTGIVVQDVVFAQAAPIQRASDAGSYRRSQGTRPTGSVPTAQQRGHRTQF